MHFKAYLHFVYLGLAFGLFACGDQSSGKAPEKAAGKESLPNPSATDLSAQAKKTAPTPVIGTDSAADIQSLMDSVEARLQRADTVGLVRLMVDDSLYRRHLFPISPAYDASSEESFKFVLGMHKANSAKGLRRVLAEVQKAKEMNQAGGKPMVFLRELDSLAVPDGMVYETRMGQGIRPFGTALCKGFGIRSACWIATFGNPGSIPN